MKNYAICINDRTANKMWRDDIVEVLDPAEKKYRGIRGHNVGEVFWCIGETRPLTADELALL